jgi:DNA polymerase III delta prime subunit
MALPLDEFLRNNQPRSFTDILGCEKWFETLVSSLKRERSTASYQPIALVGLPGVGKRALAKMYAQALVCERDFDARIQAAPCGVCDECRAMKNSSFAYVEKDARVTDGDDVDEHASAQGEAIHTLIERDGGLNTATVRIVVFDNAEAFTSSNADIALKTLEREITSSVYVFIVNDEGRFSAALRSRCSVYRVGPIPVGDLLDRLELICEQRSVAFDKAALRAIAADAGGSFGEALEILERVERHGDVTVDNLIREPEFDWGPKMLACWRAVLSGRPSEALSIFGEVGIDGPGRIRAIQAFLVECRLRHLMAGPSAGLSVRPALDLLPEESWVDILQDWAAWSHGRGIDLYEAVERALDFWASVRTGLPWEAAFLKGYEEVTGISCLTSES